MANPLTESRPRRHWPPLRRVPLSTDIAVALAIFMIEGMLFVWQTVRYDWAGWAGDVPRAEVDAAHLTSIAWTQGLLVAAIALTLLAAIFYAPFTALWQGLAAVALAVSLAVAQHGYDQSHPAPTPTPSVLYSPCYSGSGTCH
jgi:hypothetical protein